MTVEQARSVMRFGMVLIVLMVLGVFTTAMARAQDPNGGGTVQTQTAQGQQGGEANVLSENVHLFYSIAIVVGLSCVAAAYAVGKVGSAALAAAAERPELMGRALVFVGLAEGIAIYGLIIGVMLATKI